MFSNLRFEVDGHVLEKTEPRIIYLMYLLCGGIYFEGHLTSRGKLAFLVFNGITFTLLGVCGGSYLFLNLDQNLPTLFYCTRSMIGPSILLIIYIVISFVKQNLNEFMVVGNQNFNIRLRQVDGKSATTPSAFYHKKIRLEYAIVGTLSTYSVISLVNAAARPTHLYFSGTQDYNNVMYLVTPVHTFGYTLNIYSYSVIGIVQAVLGFYLYFVCDVAQTLVFAIIASIFNSCVDLANTMHDESQDYLESWINNSMTYDSREVKKYLQKFGGYSRDYMNTIGQLNRLNTFINIIIALAVAIGFLGPIPVFSTILLGRGSMPIGCIIAELVVVGLVVIILFTTCYSGALLEELNEVMIREAYNVPWFALPPRERKLPLNLLVQLQQPYTLNAMRVIPVTMNLFPRIININYSIVNLLRVKHSK